MTEVYRPGVYGHTRPRCVWRAREERVNREWTAILEAHVTWEFTAEGYAIGTFDPAETPCSIPYPPGFPAERVRLRQAEGRP